MSGATQPSATRPVSASARGPFGADPDLDRVCGCGSGMDACESEWLPSKRTPRLSPFQNVRIKATDSSSAARLSPGFQSGAPIARAASRKPPRRCRARIGRHSAGRVSRPIWRAPPAAGAASWRRRGRRAPIPSGRGSRQPATSRRGGGLVGMVLDAEQVVAKVVREPRGVEHAGGVARVGDEEVAELERMPIVQTPVE